LVSSSPFDDLLPTLMWAYCKSLSPSLIITLRLGAPLRICFPPYCGLTASLSPLPVSSIATRLGVFFEVFASHLTVGLLQVLSPSLDNSFETGGSFHKPASHLTVGLLHVLFFQSCRLGVTLPTFSTTFESWVPLFSLTIHMVSTFRHHSAFSLLTNTVSSRICQRTSTVRTTAAPFLQFRHYF
jgi:hypothetical protein